MTDWSTPGSVAPQPQRPTSAAPAGTGSDADARAPSPQGSPLPAPPAPFGPLTVADILDGAFGVLARRPGEVFSIVAACTLPVQVVLTVVLRDLFRDDSASLAPDSIFAPLSNFTFQDLLVYVGLNAVVLALATTALSALIMDWYEGRRRSVGGYLWHALRRSPVVLTAVVVVHLLEAIGSLVFLVGLYVVVCGCHLVTPIASVEPVGPFAAIGRSVRLVRTRTSVALVLPGVVALIGAAMTAALVVVGNLVASLAPDDFRWVVFGSGQLLARMIVVPVAAGVATLAYLDVRCRREGFDLTRRNDRAFDA